MHATHGVCAVALVLGACAQPEQRVQMGMNEQVVIAKLGPPKETYDLPDGGKRLMWPTQPPARESIAALKTVISRRANVSDARAASVILNARRFSGRASVRSVSTSRSSGTCCAPHSVATSSPHASPPGVVSLTPPKFRPFSGQASVLSAIASPTINVAARQGATRAAMTIDFRSRRAQRWSDAGVWPAPAASRYASTALPMVG
ncbi:hypothetical protein B0G82_4361 [Paraburkholderia sp. BL17N1]|nr:hypothetical protein B0G82_4361 [Paraburkholderia sp. BL17N1]